MKVVLLAAGYGTRLGDLTKNNPKPLIEVGGKPVLTHIIDRLNLHGLTDIIINIHYLPDMIPNKQETRALYYYEPRLLGHKGTLFALKNWLKDDDFMVINGDTLNDLNYSEMMLIHKKGSITALMDEWRAAGTWIYSKDYFTNPDIPVNPYRPILNWFDTGTPERLTKAKDYYEKSH